ncbi:hypothetical protein F2P58_23360 [Vibrio fortis]|uniref:Uncharacterized protein n=1 Tax=Vibrio fortis TaxID=212667 RepID=A0A5N3QW27_9VIBR|nr:hypothetical protein [Vibrio fortis]KAB0285455.1 hypothetical protein F2P58_23360 [Vibrio fortis]
MTIKDLLLPFLVPILSWVMSTYAFTEIMKVKMDAASAERSSIGAKLDVVAHNQHGQDVRLNGVEIRTEQLEGRVDNIEKKVFNQD